MGWGCSVIEYIYKGFMISYKVLPAAFEENTFLASGSVTYLLNRPKNIASKSIHTKYSTYQGAEHEIKKLLENHVNGELSSFYARSVKNTESQAVV